MPTASELKAEFKTLGTHAERVAWVESKKADFSFPENAQERVIQEKLESINDDLARLENRDRERIKLVLNKANKDRLEEFEGNLATRVGDARSELRNYVDELLAEIEAAKATALQSIEAAKAIALQEIEAAKFHGANNPFIPNN